MDKKHLKHFVKAFNKKGNFKAITINKNNASDSGFMIDFITLQHALRFIVSNNACNHIKDDIHAVLQAIKPSGLLKEYHYAVIADLLKDNDFITLLKPRGADTLKVINDINDSPKLDVWGKNFTVTLKATDTASLKGENVFLQYTNDYDNQVIYIDVDQLPYQSIKKYESQGYRLEAMLSLDTIDVKEYLSTLRPLLLSMDYNECDKLMILATPVRY